MHGKRLDERDLRKLPLADLAWAAGFFDGEGCIGIYNRGGNSYCRNVTVVNTDIRPLVKFRDMFGGSINSKRQHYNRGQYVCRGISELYIHVSQAEKMFRAILPYMVIKREQAELYLEFGRYLRPHNKGKSNPVYDIKKAEIADLIKWHKRNPPEVDKAQIIF